MSRLNKTCIVCGKKYSYCNGCNINEPSWKNIYCCSNCREIYHVVSEYNSQQISLKEASKRLSLCDLSEIDNFGKDYKRLIFEIQAYENSIAKKELADDIKIEHRKNDVNPSENMNHKKAKGNKKKRR